MPQRTIRFSETTLDQIQQVAKKKGFGSIAAMIRHAVDQERVAAYGGNLGCKIAPSGDGEVVVKLKLIGFAGDAVP